MVNEQNIVFQEDISRNQENIKEIEKAKADIKQLLEDGGLYRPALDLQIEICARDLIVYRRLSDAALFLNEPYLIEKSREGNNRRSINPIFDKVESASKRLTVSLEKLLLNLKDNKPEQQPAEQGASPLASLLSSIN